GTGDSAPSIGSPLGGSKTTRVTASDASAVMSLGCPPPEPHPSSRKSVINGFRQQPPPAAPSNPNPSPTPSVVGSRYRVHGPPSGSSPLPITTRGPAGRIGLPKV